MIKFFRKIRQKLLSENKFSKYLIYAIGEIVLVVIGILIALQINTWNENRKLVRLEKEILLEIKDGLQSDLEQLDKVINDHTTFINSQEKIIEWMESDKTFDDSLIPLFKQTTWITWFLPKDAQFESLKQFGVRNISNKALGAQLTYMYDVIYEKVQLWQEETRMKTLDFQRDKSRMDLQFTKYTRDLNFDMFPANPENFKANNEFLFTVRTVCETMKFYTNLHLIEAKFEVEKTINMIEEELGK